eukprot:10654176-Heterocapsa_arctica.AAC.1
MPACACSSLAGAAALAAGINCCSTINVAGTCFSPAGDTGAIAFTAGIIVAATFIARIKNA